MYRPPPSQWLLLRAFKVDIENGGKVLLFDDHPELTVPASDRSLIHTADNAWMFRWRVGDSVDFFPSKKYCLVFDSAGVDVHRTRNGGRAASLSASRYLPPSSSLFAKFQSTSAFHSLKFSNPFHITTPPALYSEDWFSRRYGGKDLERLISGKLFSPRYFSIMYNRDDGYWSSNAFDAYIYQRADAMTNWIEEEFNRVSKITKSGSRLETFDTGHSELEIRRIAASRARGLMLNFQKLLSRAGLLFHPHGRATLELLGDTMIKVGGFFIKMTMKVAAAYQNSVMPFGSWTQTMGEQLSRKFHSFWNEYISGFKSSRIRLRNWVKELKRLCSGQVPSAHLMNLLVSKFELNGDSKVLLPLLNQKFNSPRKIEDEILSAMDSMVAYEIRLVMWTVGDRLLRRKTFGGRMLDMVDMNPHNQPLLFTYAATMKTIGTKFVMMAKGYSLESGFNATELRKHL